ncbi:hypothetical protein NQ314_021349 [Rhamnusium bicolor]|uniref:Cytochrome P450 n=1 Tax=Rhamnusium bicolor TaxID=1586634 RepID=A0AAV8WHN8_9CUCU|nr:hypothetical protein NQ314_021349 [Rhamnusium bicolor]
MDEVAAQSFVIFLAGYETSATTMTFAMYELALHPEVQQRLREEIKMVLAKHDDQFTYESLNEMKYMMQVIDETFRKHPPVTFITREAVADYKIPDENLVLEKGTRMMIPILGYHHDEEYYKNPTVFDPERFNDENRKKIHPFILGERFGLMQVQVGLASILKSFKVTLNPKTEVPIKMHTNSILAAPEGGVWINVSKI